MQYSIFADREIMCILPSPSSIGNAFALVFDVEWLPWRQRIDFKEF